MRHYIKSLNLICVVSRKDLTQERRVLKKNLDKKKKMKEEGKFHMGFSRQVWRVKQIMIRLMFFGKLLQSVG